MVATLLMIGSVCFAVQNEIQMDADFVNPPNSAKPHTWWHWMGGNVTKEGITADLEAMKRVGVGGFQAFHVDLKKVPSGPVGYMGKGWRDMMKHTIGEADRLGLEMCFHNCAGWSSSGGPWIPPEYSMKKVVWTEKKVKGPMTFAGKLEQPETLCNYYRDIAVLAFPTPKSEAEGSGVRLGDWKAKAGFERKHNLKPDECRIAKDDIIDREAILVLSHKTSALGKLQWQVPAGEWTIIRFGYTSTGRTNKKAPKEGEGLECDKLSREAAELHWENSVQKVIDDAGPLAGKIFNNVLIDSYEVGSQNWTEQFVQEFQRRMGYDLINYFPAVTGRVIESPEITERFLWDFRRVIADMFTEYYFGHFAEMCHRNGLVLSIEAYSNHGGNFDEFTACSKADIAMGEWWAQAGERWHHSSSKLASSIAHTYGRKFVGAEAFTAGSLSRFVNHPYVLKSQGDYFYCQGVNRFIFHTYAHQPWMDLQPGMTMGPYGFQFNRNNTWFEKGTAWLKYLSRCQYLLQEGRFVADVCYFSGEKSPSKAPKREELEPAIPPGYDYDFCTSEILFQMSVTNGMLTLPNGMKYRVLALPTHPMRPAILRKIKSLVDAGATVCGPKPAKSPSLAGYPACDAYVESIANELWDSQKIAGERTLDEVLRSRNILPDFEFSGDREMVGVLTEYPGSGIEYIHRKIEGADVYFVSNQHQQPKLINAIFRITGKQPELWNPETGEIKDTPWYSLGKDGRTKVALPLESAGSVFVVFRKPAQEKRVESVDLAGADVVKTPRLEIKRAIYGVLQGTPDQRVDITEALRKMVQADQLSVKVDNKIAGDPARKTVKELEIEYSVDGKPFSKKIYEGQTLLISESGKKESLCFNVNYADGEIILAASKPGTYEIQKENGQKTTVQIREVSEPTILDGPWTLRFPAGWDAPEQIELSELIDWAEHEDYDIRHFSGTATYSKTFEMTAKQIQKKESIFLDLGTVHVMAEARLNGKSLGILWNPPFRVDVSDIIKPGSNVLEIEVTNLWVNRLIGDEKYPADSKLDKKGRHLLAYPEWLVQGKKKSGTGRNTFVTWLHYKEGNPLLPSGMTGPVRLIYLEKAMVK